MENVYEAPAHTAESEYSEKKSVFLGHLFPVENETDAKARVEEMKKKYADARHNVWAYYLPDGTKRVSDDGEPAGTGGAPVLDAMVRRGICGCVIVVTRYFGGILLGAGGLVHAYSTAASDALDACGRVSVREFAECEVRCAYGQYGALSRLLEKYKGRQLGTEYAEDVAVRFLIAPEVLEDFARALRDQSGGTLAPTKLGVRAVREEMQKK